jgi:beta-mannanase
VKGEDKTIAISEGEYDSELGKLIKVIREFENPVFIRIGYEFDKAGKYNSRDFVLAWKYIVNYLKKNDVNNVSTVWCSCPYHGTVPVEPFYPGDDYVDWFGIDVFTVKYIDGSYKPIKEFLDLAKKHKKPVMVGESSPARVGVNNSEESWDGWFKFYFDWIKKNPIIKAFCYINWDWGKDWKQPEWLNGRIHENEFVREKYVKELSKPKYIHNQEINKFLKKVYT